MIYPERSSNMEKMWRLAVNDMPNTTKLKSASSGIQTQDHTIRHGEQ